MRPRVLVTGETGCPASRFKELECPARRRWAVQAVRLWSAIKTLSGSARSDARRYTTVGTQAYYSPELMSGLILREQRLRGLSGCILYELMTNQLLFQVSGHLAFKCAANEPVMHDIFSQRSNRHRTSTDGARDRDSISQRVASLCAGTLQPTGAADVLLMLMRNDAAQTHSFAGESFAHQHAWQGAAGDTLAQQQCYGARKNGLTYTCWLK